MDYRQSAEADKGFYQEEIRRIREDFETERQGIDRGHRDEIKRMTSQFEAEVST